MKWSSRSISRSCAGSARSPAISIGIDSNWPIVAPTDQEAEERVRLAEELADDARDARSRPGTRRSGSRTGAQRARGGTARASPANSTRPSSSASIKLARMARHRDRPLREDHRPGQPIRRRPAPKLAVDEIGDPSEAEPDRHADGDADRQSPAAGCALRRQNQTMRDGHAERAAVEAHAALPDREDLAGCAR